MKGIPRKAGYGAKHRFGIIGRSILLAAALAPVAGRWQTVQAGAAQTPTRWDAGTLSRALLTNTFDLNQPFSAVAEIQLNDGAPLKIDAGISAQDGNLRFYVDMGSLESSLLLPPGTAKRFAEDARRTGLSRLVVIMRAGDTTRYTLYPDRRAYHTEDLQSLLPQFEVTNAITFRQVGAGAENVDGHECRKVEVQLTDGKQTQTVITLWRARDMNDFPVKIRIGTELAIDFKQVKFASLDPSLFEIPAGYRKFNSVVEIVAEAQGGGIKKAAPDTQAEVAARVLKWHQELADQGDRYGQYRMGLRYRDGDGVKKDVEQARELLQESSDQGDEDAAKALAKLPPASRARSPLAKPSDGKVSELTIVSAKFGLGTHFADVTLRLIELLRTQPNGFVVDVGSMRADPLPGKRKRLNVQYEYQGERHTFAIQAQKRLSYQALVSNAQ